MELDKKTKKTKNDKTLIMAVIIFLLISIILLTIQIISNIPQNELTFSKSYDILIIAIIILLIITIIIAIVTLKSILPQKELISTKTYDIFELKHNETFIFFSYLDENKKINKDFFSNRFFLEKLHIGDKNQITVKNFGHSGKITQTKIIKFYVTKDTYTFFSKKFRW